MCGIVGVVYHDSARPAADLSAALESIRHRGPDDSGQHRDGPAAIGMTRLSIIDLTGGHQPMSDASGRCWIVYNGEIYNYRELREELLALGYPFRTTSDTEVILAGYLHWGESVLHRLNGMFAFALWDSEARRLWLARDRIGIKPLYYTQAGGAFRFASEIKAILTDPEVPRRISPLGLANYLTYGHAIAPDTMYDGIFKLPAGHHLYYQDGRLTIERYWQLPVPSKPTLTTPEQAKHEIRTLLQDAIRSHMVADVPVGAFLSGGLDSATVVAHMVRLAGSVKTFSLGFDDAYHNELSVARMLAAHFGTEHHEIMLHSADLLPLLEKLVYYYDEPFGDASAFPTHVVSMLAARHVKVVLTGDGGDELFGGYKRYLAERWVPHVQRVPRPLRRAAVGALQHIPGQHRWKRILRITLNHRHAERYASWLTYFTPEQRRAVIMENYALPGYDHFAPYRRYYADSAALDHVNQAMYADIQTLLPEGYLEKVDKATMAASLEARVPFLDYRLVELAQHIPSTLKIMQRQTKELFRQAIADWVPQEILDLPKHGFSVPTRRWFQGELSGYIRDVLTDPTVRRRGVFRVEAIEQLWAAHRDGRGIYDTHLWLLLNFELWARRFLDG